MNDGPRHQFHTTRWSLVLAAGRQGSTVRSRAALSELCELYWPPLYGYARRQGYSVEDAQDLTQAFFARLLEKHTVGIADRERGRFRSFLLTSFKYFIANEREREAAQKRGGGVRPTPLEFENAETRYADESSHGLTPEALFERQWAATLVERALAAVHAEALTAGKDAVFREVRDLLVGEKAAEGYAAMASRLGTTEGALKVMIHRLRRRFRERLRDEIAATVSEPSDIEDELRYLVNVLGR